MGKNRSKVCVWALCEVEVMAAAVRVDRRACGDWTKELLHPRHIQEHADVPVVTGPRNYFTQDTHKNMQMCSSDWTKELPQA